MFIYGGSWRAGDKFEYEFAGRALAASGFVVSYQVRRVRALSNYYEQRPLP